MYYRLNPPYAFRGWSKLPFAIRAEYGAEIFDKPKFFHKEQFMELLYCVGTNDVKPASLTKKTQRLLEEMTNHGILEASESSLPSLEPWQVYRVFPSRYLKAVHWAITGQCNYQCRHCLVSAPDHEQTHLSLSDLLRIADEIAGCGIKAVDITGGEPLIRKDFAELCKALSERDLHIYHEFGTSTPFKMFIALYGIRHFGLETSSTRLSICASLFCNAFGVKTDKSMFFT